jgi:hypothetical protein
MRSGPLLFANKNKKTPTNSKKLKQPTRWSVLRAILWAVFSLSIVSCADRPAGDISLVDVPADRSRSRLISYDMQKDMDKNGQIIHDAHFTQLSSLHDLDKFTCFNADTWSNVKAWLRIMKEKADECQTH